MQTTEPQRLLRDAGGPAVRPHAAEIHLRDRLSVFYRYRFVAALAFLLVLGGAGLRAYSQTPLYRATVRLLIELEDERSLTMEGVSTSNNSTYVDPEPYFQTQYRILTGRDLARRVVAKKVSGSFCKRPADIEASATSASSSSPLLVRRMSWLSSRLMRVPVRLPAARGGARGPAHA